MRISTILSAVAILALAPSAAAAQSSGYKLVITWHQTGISVVDYPSAARCEQARRAVQAEIDRRMRDALAAMPPGAKVMGSPLNGAFCIPG